VGLITVYLTLKPSECISTPSTSPFKIIEVHRKPPPFLNLNLKLNITIGDEEKRKYDRLG
jgi:hypothetical protein